MNNEEEKLFKSFQKYSPISKEDWDFLSPKVQLVSFAKKQPFLRIGQSCDKLGLILSGSFRSYVFDKDREMNNYFFFENEFVSSYSDFLRQQESRVCIEALEPAQVLMISHDVIQSCYDSSKNWEKFGRVMAEKVFLDFVYRTHTFQSYSLDDRYEDLLKRHPQVFEKVPLYHIASYLGMERETLSRLRKRIK